MFFFLQKDSYSARHLLTRQSPSQIANIFSFPAHFNGFWPFVTVFSSLRTRTFALFLFFTIQVRIKSLPTQMGSSSTAVKKNISLPNLILYKVTPFKIRDHFTREIWTNLKNPQTGMSGSGDVHCIKLQKHHQAGILTYISLNIHIYTENGDLIVIW